MDTEKKALNKKENADNYLNSKSVIIILSILCFILGAFFIGNRIILTTAPDDMTIDAQSASEETTVKFELINLNTANFEQLQLLPAIGEKRAEEILKYRKEHGFFSSVEELTEIQGIGEEILKQIKEFVTVE